MKFNSVEILENAIWMIVENNDERSRKDIEEEVEIILADLEADGEIS